ncbi:MAG: 3-deoxy-D-manno-octulosonic acid transferase [Candidatus Obscuribacterales bacterium]|nr:3-deoxy-D-manno-octulosonic acid transferase [Candidatus Obscuribacterales bacterium]
MAGIWVDYRRNCCLYVIFAYYIVVAVILILIGPALLCLKKSRAGLWQKFGITTPSVALAEAGNPKGLPRIWFHAVSVGEFNAVFPLIQEFRKANPDFEIFISTTTATGQDQAIRKAGEFATVFHFPFDLPFANRRWLDFVKPDMVAIVETEIWPGFMSECRARKIPVVLINGRLSPRSFKGYMRWRWFFKSVVRGFAGIAVQSQSEAERYAALAGGPVDIEVCGNIKIDGIKPIGDEQRRALQAQLRLTSEDCVIVAGSTHEGEEKPLLEFLSKSDGTVKLILVPRHPERFERVAALIEQAGFRVRRYSRDQIIESRKDVYLLDAVGHLSRFYSVATVAFVGGTIAPVGGHNLAEPCAYDCPVVCGPHVHKTRDVASSMQQGNALLMADDSEHLKVLLRELCLSSAKRAEIAKAAKLWMRENEGALNRTLQFLQSHFHSRETPASATKLRRSRTTLVGSSGAASSRGDN